MQQKPTYLLPIICSLVIAPAANVQSFTEENNLQASVSVSEWKNAYATAGTATFTQTKQNLPNGDVYQQQLTLSYPGLADNNFLDHYLALHNQKFIIKLTYSDGRQLVMGNNHIQATATYQYQEKTNSTLLTFALSDVKPIQKFAEHLLLTVDSITIKVDSTTITSDVR